RRWKTALVPLTVLISGYFLSCAFSEILIRGQQESQRQAFLHVSDSLSTGVVTAFIAGLKEASVATTISLFQGKISLEDFYTVAYSFLEYDGEHIPFSPLIKPLRTNRNRNRNHPCAGNRC
ncbi:unnamed protein product, partial [Discosporangium mesarthrocarpum]